MDDIESLKITSEKNIILGNYQRIKEDNSFDWCVYYIFKNPGGFNIYYKSSENYDGNSDEKFKDKLREKNVPFDLIKVNIKGYKNLINQNSGIISLMNLEKFMKRIKKNKFKEFSDFEEWDDFLIENEEIIIDELKEQKYSKQFIDYLIISYKEEGNENISILAMASILAGLNSGAELSYSEFKDYVNDVYDRCNILETEVNKKSLYLKEKDHIISKIQKLERKK